MHYYYSTTEYLTSDVSPPLLDTSQNEDLIAQEIEEAFNDVEELQPSGSTDEESIGDDNDLVTIEDEDVTGYLDIESQSDGTSSEMTSSQSSKNTENSDSEDSEDTDSETSSNCETNSQTSKKDCLDLSWELVDFDFYENEKEEATNLLHRLSVVSEHHNIIEDFEKDRKSRVIRKFIGNSNLTETLENLKFRKVDKNNLDNSLCNSLYLGESLECSMVIYNKEGPPDRIDPGEGDDEEAPSGDALESTVWKGDFLGGSVEVEIEELNGINVVSLQVEHKDILSTLLSFQRFVACTGVVSYCDVDVSSLLSHTT